MPAAVAVAAAAVVGVASAAAAFTARTEGEMINTYQKMVDRMQLAGLGLKHHRLDNGCSENFKKCIRKNNMTHEQVPPGCHRRNMAERAIQTFKNHFVTILSRVDDRFCLSLWCYLIRPAELTVNLLRQSNMAPKILTYAHVHGHHDYMKCATRMFGDGTRQTKKQTYLGCPRRGRVQHRHIDGASLVLQRVHRKNESEKNQRYQTRLSCRKHSL